MSQVVTFGRSSHPRLYQDMLLLLDRIEALAYQAERGFWDMATAEWYSQGYISDAPQTIADTLCAGAESVVNQFLSNLAVVCGETHVDIDWSGNLNALYVGGRGFTYLPVTLNESAASVDVGGINQINVTGSVSRLSRSEEQTTSNTEHRVVIADGVIAGLRSKVKWLSHWYANAYSSDMRTAYDAALGDVYDWATALCANLGPKFASPITSFYSVNATGSPSPYDRPRLEAQFTDDGATLRLACLLDYASETRTCPQNYIWPLSAGDLVHVVRLGMAGYEQYEDRVYVVTDITVDGGDSYLDLYAPTDEMLVDNMTPAASKFGDWYLIRKLRGGA